MATDECEWKGSLLDYVEHYHQHFKVKPKVKCQYCRLDFAKESDLAAHVDITNGTCPKQPIDCIFKAIGCNINELSNNVTMASNVTPSTSTGDQQMEISNEDTLALQTNANGVLLR